MTAGVILLAIVLANCASGESTPANQFKGSILNTEDGQLVGAIGIVSAQYAPELRLQTPAKEWLFRAERGALIKGKDTYLKGMQYFTMFPCAGGGKGCGAVALVSLAWFTVLFTGSSVVASVGAVQGGIEGAIAAPDPATVEKAEEIARNALSALQTQESMAAALDRALHDWARDRIPPPKIQRLVTAGPVRPEEHRRYDTLAKEGIDIVIETSVQTVRYESDGSVNPLLRLSLKVAAKAVRVSDGITLHSGLYDYQSDQHAFEVWASDDGAYLLIELDRGYKVIAQEIVGSLS